MKLFNTYFNYEPRIKWTEEANPEQGHVQQTAHRRSDVPVPQSEVETEPGTDEDLAPRRRHQLCLFFVYLF